MLCDISDLCIDFARHFTLHLITSHFSLILNGFFTA